MMERKLRQVTFFAKSFTKCILLIEINAEKTVHEF